MCEPFDVQQPPELTVELLTTQSGRMQEHSSSPSTERFPSQRAVQRTESGTHRIWLAELQVCFSPRATMERGLVPRQLCRAGCARPAASRQLGGPLRCSRGCCRSYPLSSLPLCALPWRQTCHCDQSYRRWRTPSQTLWTSDGTATYKPVTRQASLQKRSARVQSPGLLVWQQCQTVRRPAKISANLWCPGATRSARQREHSALADTPGGAPTSPFRP